MARKRAKKVLKSVEALTHEETTRKNIPTAEYESLMQKEQQSPICLAYERRNRDLDPQLVWRGKDEQDQSDLVVHAPPLYIQEKVHPKALIDDMLRQTGRESSFGEEQIDLFSDFNGLPNDIARTEFYQHDANWSNRMVLGDSLQVMSSLCEREGLREKVQCIYIDPPYGIKFNSNFQWSTASRDVRDGKVAHITREPEQVKAFRDTWKEGIHSYLTYLRDRLTVARELLSESGSIFVQIGDENVHRVRSLLDEVFGDRNFVAQITFRVKSPLQVSDLARTCDFLLWYGRNKPSMKFRQPRIPKSFDDHPEFSMALLKDGSVVSRKNAVGSDDARYFTAQNLASSGYTQSCMYEVKVDGRTFNYPKGKSWKTHKEGMERLRKAGRLQPLKTSLRWRYFFDDAPSEVVTDVWRDTFAAPEKSYVVQTSAAVVQRCILMSTDPGDVVLDPTCGSGTTCYVAEQWGRRWIAIDTSRIALALARARIMGARYPYYLLSDSQEGQLKEAEVSGVIPSGAPTSDGLRQGFVYERVPHVTLKSIANNTEIDVIWNNFEQRLEVTRNELKQALGEKWQEWEVRPAVKENWSGKVKKLHEAMSRLQSERQKQIDASIGNNADYHILYDRPFQNNQVVRVSGPFTVESISPHRMMAVDHDDELISGGTNNGDKYQDETDFVKMILENLKTAGVHQAHKEDRITFVSLAPWPGSLVCAEGIYLEEGADTTTEAASTERRAAIFVGPEFATVTRTDLVAAAREAAEADFDVLVSCAFNYDAHSSEFNSLGRIPVLKARMNADLHMADDLKNTGKGNLFVIFGEPDLDIIEVDDDRVYVQINGVDVFHPQTGEVRSDGPDGIACWFIDTDYNEESFFVRHAYFLGSNNPYKALRRSLKAEIDIETWETLHSSVSRPFERPRSGRIAVKVINQLGDEVMKVFRVERNC